MSEGTKAVVLNYTGLSDDRKADVQYLKKLAAQYYDAVVEVEKKYGRQRDFSVAKTKIQEASMWATRGITNPEGSE
jgi:hypothetical protein